MSESVVKLLTDISWFISHSFLSQNAVIFVFSWAVAGGIMSYLSDKYLHLWSAKIVLAIFLVLAYFSFVIFSFSQ